jgi:PAS domain S-box-containing protein
MPIDEIREQKKKEFSHQLQGLHRIINELQNLHSSLLDSEQRFRIVAEYACDWEYWQDTEGKYVYVSPSCKTITGYEPADFRKNPDLMRLIVAPDEWERWVSHSHKERGSGDPEPLEFRICDKQGRQRWIEHVCRPIAGDHSENLGIRGSNRDITELKLARDELKALKGLLPICAQCKRIRDENGRWMHVEEYVADHSEARFTHGYCPECGEKAMKCIQDRQSSIQANENGRTDD